MQELPGSPDDDECDRGGKRGPGAECGYKSWLPWQHQDEEEREGDGYDARWEPLVANSRQGGDPHRPSDEVEQGRAEAAHVPPNDLGPARLRASAALAHRVGLVVPQRGMSVRVSATSRAGCQGRRRWTRSMSSWRFGQGRTPPRFRDVSGRSPVPRAPVPRPLGRRVPLFRGDRTLTPRHVARPSRVDDSGRDLSRRLPLRCASARLDQDKSR